MCACVKVDVFGMIHLVVKQINSILIYFLSIYIIVLILVLYESIGSLCTSVVQCDSSLGLTCSSGYCT